MCHAMPHHKTRRCVDKCVPCKLQARQASYRRSLLIMSAQRFIHLQACVTLIKN